MKKNLLFLFLPFCAWNSGFAQTFTGTGGTIADNVSQCFTVPVTGVGIINGSYGLAKVCFNITHTYDGDLTISLKSPDGTTVILVDGVGGSGANFTNTCLLQTAASSISNGSAPFTGNFLPQANMGLLNNGQNANGTWTLCISDNASGDVGTLQNFSLTFNNTPAPPPPPAPTCSNNAPAGNTCTLATSVCNFNGYCGNTSSTYTADSWSQLLNTFCGTIENNSFIKFTATATSVQFNVWVTNSLNGDGIQMFFYDGGCGSGNVTSYGCYNLIDAINNPHLITGSGLTIGNVYYLMIDGYAGDVCNYAISPVNGVAALGVVPPSAIICTGNSVGFTASGGNGIYNWSPATGLSSTTGTSVTANPAVTTTYTVTSTNPVAGCGSTTTSTNVIVTVNSGGSCNVPVTITSFHATALPSKTVQLHWQTAQELGILKYKILRSTNSTGGFSEVGSVNAITTGNGSNSYSFTDNSVQADQTYFYKLEMVENTGVNKFSTVRSIRINGSKLFVALSPNPSNNQVKVQLGNYAGLAQVQLIDNNGVVVLQQNIAAFNFSPVAIDIGRLPAATYTMVVNTNNDRVVTKLVKQ